MTRNIYDVYLDKIITLKVPGGKFLKSRSVNGGHTGFVYEVDVKLNLKIYKFIVKLSKIIGAWSLKEERPEQRVYGGRSRSFENVYKLLINNKIPTFKLLSYGLPTKEVPYFYQVLSRLEGFSIREHLTLSNCANKNNLLKLSGTELGKLHLITRSYDGWVGQKKPYTIKWKDSFLKALDIRLHHFLKSNYLSLQQKQELIFFIKEKKRKWTNPKEYVLSHVDGLQGMAEYRNKKWIFSGHIDLEDYRFTDQRFVLAGLEIGSNYSIKDAPRDFWEGYLKFKKVDRSFHVLKDLFKLFYFMSWIQMTDKSTENIKLSSKINKGYVDKIILITNIK